MDSLYFIGNKHISISINKNEEINKKIENFVASMETKGQSKDHTTIERNAYKFSEDTAIGKKGECLALKMLVREYGFPPTNIDWQVRRGKSKGWVKDLIFDNHIFPNIDIKTCSTTTIRMVGQMSWTFQLTNKSGKGGRDPILDSSGNDIVAFVFVESYLHNYGSIMALLPFKSVKEYLKPPKKESLKDLKTCIYYQDLLVNKEKILCSI